MAPNRGLVVAGAAFVAVALVALIGVRLGGTGDTESLLSEIALPLMVLAVASGLMASVLAGTAIARVVRRRRRDLARYQLVLSQADEAPSEEVAAACEQVVQTLRSSLAERFVHGQAWLAIESWFIPSPTDGETGTCALMLVCEPHARSRALAALRHAYPDLALRLDPRADGEPMRFAEPRFMPAHVLRVRKARTWALPLGPPSKPDASNARSTMADVIRQQQHADRISCVRWCILPTGEWLDSRAHALAEAAAADGPSGRVTAAAGRQVAGGAMAYLELQAGIEAVQVPARRGGMRDETFGELQSAARRLLAPALSQRGSNHLAERLMWARQRLYRQRWTRAEPPLLPDLRGCTLVAPRELALLMELPSLGSEHALPLQRNTVPQLPVPVDVPRAKRVELRQPPTRGQGDDGGASVEESDDPGIALGCGLPNVPWTIRQADRRYGIFLAGGQNSGKSSKLLRIALNDIEASNTATIVLDLKGSLSERLVRLTAPGIPKRWWDQEAGQWQTGTKRLWYLDLRRPAFGLTPLQVEAGWTHTGLADEFARIADAVTRALLDLYPGQIMGSSEDLIERAVVGTMAIAWWEHEARCDREGRDPTAHGFAGSFEVLAQMFAPSDKLEAADPENRGRRRVAPNRWHQAAGRACQKLPNLDQVSETLLFEIPRQARDNLGDIARRMEAPANKIRPLVGAQASVRRFVGHPERLSLRSVVEAHDILVVNPRLELIGEDQASILTNFIVHMLDMELKRQLAVPAQYRPWVSLIVDEGHRLVNETLIRMAATHREANLTLAIAVQYVAQLGADAPSAQARDQIRKGVGNLLQTKMLFRLSDTDDAEAHSQIFRSVYETMVRADPTSRARMPFDPSRLPTLRDFHSLNSTVSTADATASSGLVDDSAGATRLIPFADRAYPMPEVDEIADTWRDAHLNRQAEVFRRYPEDMSALARHEVPAGLMGRGTSPEPTNAAEDAREVAEQTVGRVPEGALRKGPPPASAGEYAGSSRADSADAATLEFASSVEPQTDRSTSTARPDEPAKSARSREHPYSEQLFDPDGTGPGWERIGGVRIQRSEQPAPEPAAEPLSRVLTIACQHTKRPLPPAALAPASATAEQALREAAALERIAELSEWTIAGDEVKKQARRAAEAAQEEARTLADASGQTPEEAQREAARGARDAVGRVLRGHADAPWRRPANELDLPDHEARTLEVIARLKFAVPRVLAGLLPDAAGERALRNRLGHLFDSGLIARSEVVIPGRHGRRPRVFTIAPRGLEYLRSRHATLRPDNEPPGYLQAKRQLPSPGKGSELAHELAVQLVAIALDQFGASLHWHTTRMPGGRWDIGMIHGNPRDRTLTLADLAPRPGITVHGEHMRVQTVLEPDLSVQLQGRLRGELAVIDALVEVDRTRRGAYNTDKFAAYDHFLGGWCLRTRRWGSNGETDARGGRPLLLVVAITGRDLMVLLHAADTAMTLGLGKQGQYDPATFSYPGRAHTVFTALEWLLGGQAIGLQLPPLPPNVRGHDGELAPERVAILPESWWPSRTKSAAREPNTATTDTRPNLA